MELQELLLVGEKLGLEGATLREWIEKEQAKDREKRAEERELVRERLRVKELEVAREKEAARALEEAAKVRAEEEQRCLELRIKLQELQNNGSGQVATTTVAREAVSTLPVTPHRWLAPFDEKRDDLDAYLLRFERLATGQRWPKEQWATALSVCLAGESLGVFARLTPEDSANYDQVKKALLQRFRLTAEGFRERFRNGKPEDGETGTQFAARLSNLFDRWVDISETKKDYEGLRDLLITEQFIKGCPSKLATFLRERKTGTLTELATMADRFLEAQNHANRGRGDESKMQEESRRVSNGRNGRDREDVRKQKRCYLCNRLGHIASDCRTRVGTTQRNVTCYTCGKIGHTANYCQERGSKTSQASCVVAPRVEEKMREWPKEGYVVLQNGEKLPIVNAFVTRNTKCLGDGMPVVVGRLGSREITVLRDTGSNTAIVRKSLVSEDDMTGETNPVVLVDGTVKYLPEAQISIRTPFYSGVLTVKCMESPLYDVILGNLPNVRAPDDPNSKWEEEDEENHCEEACEETGEEKEFSAAVETRHQARERAQGKKNKEPLLVPEIEGWPEEPAEIGKAQQEDESLKCCFERLGQKMNCRNENHSYEYVVRGGMLYRMYRMGGGRDLQQLAVPKKYRQIVLQMAHDGIMAGHQGVQKTTDRILTEFFWPGVQAEVQRFVRSCDQCQRTTPKGRVSKVPLGSMPTIEAPFQRVAVDIVGPISPKTARGNQYILTMVDYATRYPDAVALPGITTEHVAEGLVEMFTRTGIPNEILSDRGPAFVSEAMREVSRLLSLKQIHTTPYHPMGNGLVEKFNGTIKTMLKRMCQEKPKEWDRYLAPLLFAYREVPQASLGFSPFELLYGRHVRGPLSVLRELWTNSDIENDVKTTYQYVFELRNKLEETCKVAHEELERAGARYRQYYNRKARVRKLQVGDRALILLPTDRNKLLMQWKGPFPIQSKKGEVDYAVDLGHTTKVFHVNMLKRYEERKEHHCEGKSTEACSVLTIDGSERHDSVPMLNLEQKEDCRHVVFEANLTQQQRKEAGQLVHKFQEIMSDVPGQTSVTTCQLEMTTPTPVHTKQYPLPFAVRKAVEEEVQAMLRMGIIEKSTSAYDSPVLVVRKPDNTHRLCVDFRKLNDGLKADAEPIPRADHLFAEIGKKKFFTKLDFSKGYWQIPLDEESKPMTAFSTASGLYQFRYMPFGLKTAPAIFTRLMRKLFDDMPDVKYYYDDVLIASDTWDEHMAALREVFGKIRNAGLTIRPTKCEIGLEEVTFLEHRIGKGHVAPLTKLVEKIQNAERPKTKRQVRAFLGLTGYYRDFIPHYAEVATPLTELTRKRSSNTVDWRDEHEAAFNELKRLLTVAPILRLPDLGKEFILRTDASDKSLGAILLQEYDGIVHPVAYASRRLLPREAAYATVEREGLALIWGIHKFHTYLYGKRFVLQTDHQPLVYINRKKHTNTRVMRWSLQLQEYDFCVQYLKGSENVGADYLSRI
ncbi:uncharacterized protein LOC135384523 [Ornithodoros turicata]|uniref:uncharacterized protein LOC135384523 n=1 Tax=Ornithodoros turicata TaxID=34597 RepID=UPI00313924AC